jgi:hypothetical protein
LGMKNPAWGQTGSKYGSKEIHSPKLGNFLESNTGVVSSKPKGVG